MNFCHKLSALLLSSACALGAVAEFKTFPDGQPVDKWFNDTSVKTLAEQGRQYDITANGVVKGDTALVQTEAIQAVIDLAASQGGGVVVVPEGTYLTGSLFFRPGVNLHLAKGARLKGSDAITHYQIIKTRLEGQTLDYFAALVNAIGCDGFTITGEGTIDGNGYRFYDEFWLRRKVNRKCTNLEALRPRMLYVADSKDVSVSGITMKNSGFWTNHIYRCERVKYVGVTMLAPTEGYPKGPSTDALDLDVCRDVLVSGCYMSVNDDAVCLKGGKGTWVDTIAGNGPVGRVIIDRCHFRNTNAGVTFGSEAWDCSNVILNDCTFDNPHHVLLFKMRPDTPQRYRNVLVSGVKGTVRSAVEVQPWRQFYDKADRDPMPESSVSNVTCRDMDVTCSKAFFSKGKLDGAYTLSNFTFEDIKASEPDGVGFDTEGINVCVVKNVVINGVKY